MLIQENEKSVSLDGIARSLSVGLSNSNKGETMRDKFSKRKIKQLGKKFGYKFVDSAVPSELFVAFMKYRDGGEVIGLSREHDFLAYVLQHFGESKAQIFQDLFVLFLTKQKRNGYFVEFGATNGITLSNTYLLETGFGWNGILAEPALRWHDELKKNRHCTIETRCVWTKTGEQLNFNETVDAELSTIETFSNRDNHSSARVYGNKYIVDTMSLNDLLEIYDAPRYIDYLSVDTEGSELAILSHFDFPKYDIRIITVEHNFTGDREKIHTLLSSKGYTRIFEGFSQWDDWFVKTE